MIFKTINSILIDLPMVAMISSLIFGLFWLHKYCHIFSPVGMNLLKVKNGDTRPMFEFCSNLTTRTPELVLVSLLLNLNRLFCCSIVCFRLANVGWEATRTLSLSQWQLSVNGDPHLRLRSLH